MEKTLKEFAGFVLFKEKKFFVFYVNDLGETPGKDLEGRSDYNLNCVYGLVPLNR